MTKLKPYADDAASSAVGKLVVENGRDRVLLYGSLELTRDAAGLAHARKLRALLNAVVQALEADPALPGRLPPPAEPDTVDNPFG